MPPEALALPGMGFAPRVRVLGRGATAVTLRPYQEQGIRKIREQLAENRSTLLVFATGTGKTTVFGALAGDKSWGRVLVLAHRDELIQQAAKRLEAMTGETVDVEQADSHSAGARIVVASIQSISRERRLTRFLPDTFGLVIVDEAHHAVADTYQAVTSYFTGKLLGVTATPDRGDRLALGKVFDSVAMVYDISDAIADRWLAPIVPRRIEIDVDLSQIRTVAGDLNQGQLDEAMGQEHVLEGVVRPTFEQAGDRKTVLFTTSVLNAHKMAGIFNELRDGCAKAVDGSMQIDDRRRVLSGYARGDFQFLCNVMIATEGWDDPATSCVAIGRPTKSRALFTQMIGRGLRIFPGKESCLVLDFAGNAGKHSLVSPFDVLAGKYTDEEVELAKDIAGNKPGIQANVALEAARDEIRARAKKKVTARVSSFDPFAILHVSQEENDQDWQFGRREPTQPQLNLLAAKGIETKGLSFRQASKLIGTVKKRQDLGLATFKHLKILQRHGITDINLSFSKASSLVDLIAGHGWKTPPRDRVNAILHGSRAPGEEG